jgi:hypothetical protein
MGNSMRSINEIDDPAKLLEFAKSKRLLQFSSHESLGEITSLLYKIVMFADKNMPIRAYLDVVREMQGSFRQVDNLGVLQNKEVEIAAMPDSAKKSASLAALAEAKKMIENIRLPYQTRIDNILNVTFKAHPNLAGSLQSVISAQRPLAFEDEFVLVVSFLDLEVSKLGAITYLKGESPDYKETKRNRTLLDTRDEGVLKSLSAGLTRPNDQRGSVEMGMILSSQNRLSKLIRLHEVMPEVVRLLSTDKTKLDVLREVRVGGDKLTLTDYDIISRMARREKLVTFRNRQKDPDNKYELRGDNHLRVKTMADKWGITPRRALNKILDDFWAITEKQKEFGVSTRPATPTKE